jgi:hypothetical protein
VQKQFLTIILTCMHKYKELFANYSNKAISFLVFLFITVIITFHLEEFYKQTEIAKNIQNILNNLSINMSITGFLILISGTTFAIMYQLFVNKVNNFMEKAGDYLAMQNIYQQILSEYIHQKQFAEPTVYDLKYNLGADVLLLAGFDKNTVETEQIAKEVLAIKFIKNLKIQNIDNQAISRLKNAMNEKNKFVK